MCEEKVEKHLGSKLNSAKLSPTPLVFKTGREPFDSSGFSSIQPLSLALLKTAISGCLDVVAMSVEELLIILVV